VYIYVLRWDIDWDIKLNNDLENYFWLNLSCPYIFFFIKKNIKNKMKLRRKIFTIINIKRYFSYSLILLTDSPADILARIEFLMKQNKDLIENSKSELLTAKKDEKIIEQMNNLQSERYREEGKMKGHLLMLFNNLNKEEKIKLDKDNASHLRLQELYNQKLMELNKDDPDYSNKLYNIENVFCKSINKRLNTIEIDINKAVERKMEEGIGNVQDHQAYYIMRAARLKEREEFMKKEELLATKLKEDLESKTSISDSEKETPTEFVRNLSETEMPSYMDPED